MKAPRGTEYAPLPRIFALAEGKPTNDLVGLTSLGNLDSGLTGTNVPRPASPIWILTRLRRAQPSGRGEAYIESYDFDVAVVTTDEVLFWPLHAILLYEF